MRMLSSHHLRRTLLALTVASALAAVALASSAAGKPDGPRARSAVPGEILVGFKATVSASAQDSILAAAGARGRDRFAAIHGALVSVAPGSTAHTIQALKRDPRVAYAEPNFVLHAADVTPNDPFFTRLWGLNNVGQTVNYTAGTSDADIDAPEAWSVSTGSPDVVVAVIDTGVDATHPDLGQNIWVNDGEDCSGCRLNGIDDDGNGYVDDWRGWDFANGDNNPADDNGHGTHVAGTVAATGNNGLGVAGVTWSSRIMPLKFLGADGSGTTDDAISAILYARAKGVPILNNSWGGGDGSEALRDAIEQTDSSGELFVAAAGNDFTNTDVEPFYPASYDVPNILVVGASDQLDRKAWFSNYGVRTVDLSAPGTNVYSTWTGATYRFADGTSMATPQVSGAAALARAVFPNASGVGLKALLLRDVDPIAALNMASRTGGRLNVDHAARCAGTPQAWIESSANGTEVSAGQPLEIRVLGALCGSPGGVSVSATLNGSPFPLDARGDGLYSATHVPQAGAVNLTVTATAGAASDVQSVTAMANQTFQIVPGGSPVTITTHSAAENAWLTFDGQTGQRIALRMSDVTIGPSPCCSTYVWIYKPDGAALGSQTLVGTNGGFVDTRSLPATGQYRILVDPQQTATGSMTLTLYDVPPDVTTTIAPAGPAVTVTTGPVPGQNALATFSGNQGQRVALKLSNVTIGTSTCCSARVSILKPDGSTLVFATPFGTSGGFVDTRSLPVSGTYAILLDPQLTDVGSATLTLYDVPPDVTSSITPGGSPATVSMGPVPGQNALVSFSGTQGQRIALGMTNVTIGTSTCCSARVSITRPDGSTLVYATPVGRNGGFLDTKVLPMTGTYTILVDPQGADLGSMTLSLYDVPPGLTGTIAIGGGPVSLTLAPTPGQNATLTFNGTAAQRVSLRLSNVTIGNTSCCGAKISILKPDGTIVVPPILVGSFGATINATLPVTGTYSIVVDPQGAYTGGITLTLSPA
jgi:subtilisin family serine protease